MKTIRLSSDLAIPAETALVTVFGNIGKRGGGKTGATKRMAEEFYRLGLPFIILDPVGIHWGLRSSFDGKKPSGIKVLVVGGEHGDIAIDPRAGAEVAKAIVESNVSAVIDLSRNSKTDWRRFVAEFSEALFRHNRAPRHVFIEEAQEFCPQHPLGRELAMSASAVEKLVTLGRNKGLGVTLVTQRPAKLHKDVLTQLDTLLCFGVLSPQDRKALHDWVEAAADKTLLNKFDDGIARLEPQEAWVWSPVVFKVFQKVKVSKFATFHPDVTHLQKMGAEQVKPAQTDVTPIIDRLGGVMKRLAQEKKDQASAPEMKVEMQRLREQLERLKAAPRPQGPDPASARKEAEKAVRQIAVQAEQWAAEVARVEKKFLSVVSRIDSNISNFRDELSHVKGWLNEARPQLRHRAVPTLPAEAPMRRESITHPQAPFTVQGAEEDGIGRSHLRVLKAIVELQANGFENPDPVQVATWAKYKYSGTFRNYLGRLHTAGLIERQNGVVGATEDGRKAAGGITFYTDRPAWHAHLQEVVGSKWGILAWVITAHPRPVPREDLAAALGKAYSGTFRNYLGSLRTMGLIDYTKEGVVATPFLMKEG